MLGLDIFRTYLCKRRCNLIKLLNQTEMLHNITQPTDQSDNDRAANRYISSTLLITTMHAFQVVPENSYYNYPRISFMQRSW